MAPRRSAFGIVNTSVRSSNFRHPTYLSNRRLGHYQRRMYGTNVLRDTRPTMALRGRINMYHRNSAARMIQSRFRRTRPGYVPRYAARPVRRMTNPYLRRRR